jgi:hypothetical protein
MRVKKFGNCVDLKLMDGLQVSIREDGTWLEFRGDKQISSVRLESLGNEAGIIRGGITNWCQNIRTNPRFRQ